MIFPQPIEISTACLLRTMFWIGACISVFFGPRELAKRQWTDAPVVEFSSLPTSQPPQKKAEEPKIDDFRTPKAIKAEQELHQYILTTSMKHSVDPALVKAVILVESGYDAKAVSPKGAKGLMQLMPHIIELFGVKDAFNPIHNINGGVKYLSELLRYFHGNLYLSLAAYNAGIGRVIQSRPLPSATRQFVMRVLEFYAYYQSGFFDQKRESSEA